MKKAVFVLFISMIFSILSAEEPLSGYKINYVEYNIAGQTRESQLARKVHIDRQRIFSTEEELDAYIADLSQQYTNLRIFDSVEILKTYTEDETQVCFVSLRMNLTDSKHLLFLPYPKYSSNDGFTFKLKLKDDDFLGTISPLEGEGKLNIDGSTYKLGGGVAYNLPFSAGPFDFSWNNDYSMLYTIGESSPCFDLNSGITVSLPFRHVSYVANFMQSAVHGDEEHDIFGNNTFYKEWGEFSIPVKFTPSFLSVPLTVEPYTAVSYIWSNESINDADSELSTPVYGGGTRISAGRVNWEGNFRNGLELKLDGNYSWDYNKNSAVPYVKANVKAFKAFNRFALSSNLDFFAEKDRTHTIGKMLRGIPDTPELSKSLNNNIERLAHRVLYVPASLTLNLDMPVHLFNFTPSPESKIHSFGFECQVSPFFDAALTRNDLTGRTFDLRDGWYSGGLEFLVYPVKWKSVVVRGSIGIDLGKYVISKISDGYDRTWRDDISGYEIYIGLGLSY